MGYESGTGIGAPESATKKRLLDLFVDDLDYDYLGDKTNEDNRNVLPDLLAGNLERRGYTRRAANAAVVRLQTAAGSLVNGNLYAANKEVYSLLKYGARVPDGRGGIVTVKFIEFDPARIGDNDFQIAEEVTVAGFHDKRPDLVVYVNGIALAVVELKRASVSVVKGICQNIANQEEMFIRPFFTTMQLLCAGNSSEGLRYGTIGTPAKYYLEWRHDGFRQHPDERDPDDVRLERESKRFAEKLDAQVFEMFDRRRFLDIVRNFVVFDRGRKKVCRYSQFYGIKRALARTKKGQGGIVWHSQGSGKSIEMVLLAKHLLERNPDGRILVVTDREELDDQIEKLFKGVDETIVRTTSGKDLVGRLNDAAGGRLLCSLVHKFGRRGGGDAGDDEAAMEKYLADIRAALPRDFRVKGEFTVFVDECHRTHSGRLHEAMKTIMPGAILVGFTGTPLLRKDKKTSLEVFGPYIHTYKFPEAVRDGVILDLRYEARDIPQDVTAQEQIDAWFESKTRGLTPKAKAVLKQRWATMQSVVSSKGRLAKVVEDIILDFATKPRLMDGRGNAILVAEDILAACRYYNLFQDHGFRRCAVVSSYLPVPGEVSTAVVDPDRRTEEQIKYETYRRMVGVKDGEEARDIAARVEAFEKEAKRQFVEEPANMQLLIVVDKLLTGFDAPPCTYLYIDRHMQDHGLFQAICRVNRLEDETKEFGYVVDYQKLFGDLKDSLAKYTSDTAFAGFDTEDVEDLVKNLVKEARDRFVNVLESLDALCEGVEPPAKGPEYRAYFGCGPAETPEEEELLAQRREKLYRLVGMLGRAYATLGPRMDEAGFDEKAQARCAERVKFYLELRKDIGQASGDFLDLKPYEPDMRYLIDTYISAGDGERLDVLEDFTLLSFIEAKKAESEAAPPPKKEQDGISEAIENNATKELVRKRLVNPAFFERMSQVLKRLIEDRKAGVLEYRRLLEEYRKLAEQLRNPALTGRYPASIVDSPVKQALYDNFGEDEALALALHRAFLGSKLQGFKSNLAKQNKIKQALWNILKDDEKVEAVYRILAAQEVS